MSIHTEWMDAVNVGAHYLTEKELSETHPYDEEPTDDRVLLLGTVGTAVVFTGTREQLLSLIDRAHAALLGPDEHGYVVTVAGCTEEQANQVIRERCGPDEDYGFGYTISYR